MTDSAEIDYDFIDQINEITDDYAKKIIINDTNIKCSDCSEEFENCEYYLGLFKWTPLFIHIYEKHCTGVVNKLFITYIKNYTRINGAKLQTSQVGMR